MPVLPISSLSQPALEGPHADDFMLRLALECGARWMDFNNRICVYSKCLVHGDRIELHSSKLSLHSWADEKQHWKA